jgi:hypothetical protein
MTSPSNHQEEKDKFFEKLRSLTLKDLVLLYIEANTGTGTEEDIDMIPIELLNSAEKLTDKFSNTWREKQTEKLLDNLFKQRE